MLKYGTDSQKVDKGATEVGQIQNFNNKFRNENVNKRENNYEKDNHEK